MNKVYIERKESEFLNHNCYVAWDGFWKRGYETVYFQRKDLESLPLTKEDIVVGSINSVKTALKLLNIKEPENIDLPESILPFAYRKVWQTTLGEIRKLELPSVFIKPLKHQKYFTGHVVETFKDLIQTSHLEEEFQVLAQEVIKIDSEWRFYVLKKKIVGCANYNGDPLLFPNWIFVQDVLRYWKDPPIACSIDIGVTRKQSGDSTFLIEVNDGYALGNYGLSAITYSKMIEERWKEMIKVGT